MHHKRLSFRSQWETTVKINDEYDPVNIGAMLGEGCDLAFSVAAKLMVIVGNNSRIQPLKVTCGRSNVLS